MALICNCWKLATLPQPAKHHFVIPSLALRSPISIFSSNSSKANPSTACLDPPPGRHPGRLSQARCFSRSRSLRWGKRRQGVNDILRSWWSATHRRWWTTWWSEETNRFQTDWCNVKHLEEQKSKSHPSLSTWPLRRYCHMVDVFLPSALWRMA